MAAAVKRLFYELVVYNWKQALLPVMKQAKRNSQRKKQGAWGKICPMQI